jgi:hypothetical protein
VGDLPEACAALNRTNINPQILTVEAALTRSRDLVYQAAMLDPHTSAELTIDQIRRLCDDLIAAHGAMLPPFRAAPPPPRPWSGLDRARWRSPYVESWKMSRLLPAATLNDLPAASLNQPLGWKPIRASGSTPGFMNVHDRTGGADGLVYLANRFLAAGAGNWTLCLAHDGGARVFVDGKAVYTDPVRVNPAADRCARIPLHLSKGSHEIVVALDTDNGNGWGLFCRFEVPEKARSGKPMFPKRIG